MDMHRAKALIALHYGVKIRYCGASAAALDGDGNGNGDGDGGSGQKQHQSSSGELGLKTARRDVAAVLERLGARG